MDQVHILGEFHSLSGQKVSKLKTRVSYCSNNRSRGLSQARSLGYLLHLTSVNLLVFHSSTSDLPKRLQKTFSSGYIEFMENQQAFLGLAGRIPLLSVSP